MSSARASSVAALAATLLGLALAACGSPAGIGSAGGGKGGVGIGAGRTAATGTPTEASTASLSGRLTVVAAASLTESFDALERGFEAANPGVSVEMSYGSSATLVQQVNAGAPADVVALAGQSAADPLENDRVTASAVFATNVLEIAVPPDNPGGVTGIADLARPGLAVVLCAETVPCGKAADATFAKAGVVPSVVSREVDVKATLAKVKLGEADAAVVYHSDVVSAKGAVAGVAIPQPVNTTLRNPIITLTDTPAAQAFVAYVLGETGQATMRSFGFGAP